MAIAKLELYPLTSLRGKHIFNKENGLQGTFGCLNVKMTWNTF